MIEIKPKLEHRSHCPSSGQILKPVKTLWHGSRICVVSESPGGGEIIDELRIGHAAKTAYSINLAEGTTFSDDKYAEEFLAKPLLKSLQNPQNEHLEITQEIFKSCDRVIVLNCIDYLYGHSLLKLLNAQRHLESNPEFGLIVIVQKFMRWMVPEGVAEVWTVPISLKNGQSHYPSFDAFVSKQLERFQEVYISEAYSHPSQFDISKFTGVPKHDFDKEEYKITFVWREDRLWCRHLLVKIFRKLNWLQIPLSIQNWKVRRLFAKMRKLLPQAKFAVAGLGKNTSFPEWVEDFRVDKFDEKTERQLCQVYSESRLVIGIHGSNMLLPSGHAGMTIDMIDERWGNFAQDILYQEKDPRLSSFRYRYLPLATSLKNLAHIGSEMIIKRLDFYFHMTGDSLRDSFASRL
ncbi:MULTISPECIES: hypothetical protein [unclassified Microcoleus]|uniref:hypothetical protein n=1 Tax=unclassified Microcoleus TaxID=2642155 RepID=UPI0025E712C1|nr:MULTISPECIES: hypothetical protein [unclassified Microcoleus]